MFKWTKFHSHTSYEMRISLVFSYYTAKLVLLCTAEGQV